MFYNDLVWTAFSMHIQLNDELFKTKVLIGILVKLFLSIEDTQK